MHILQYLELLSMQENNTPLHILMAKVCIERVFVKHKLAKHNKKCKNINIF